VDCFCLCFFCLACLTSFLMASLLLYLRKISGFFAACMQKGVCDLIRNFFPLEFSVLVDFF
jgi:hypothetical protein